MVAEDTFKSSFSATRVVEAIFESSFSSTRVVEDMFESSCAAAIKDLSICSFEGLCFFRKFSVVLAGSYNPFQHHP